MFSFNFVFKEITLDSEVVAPPRHDPREGKVIPESLAEGATLARACDEPCDLRRESLEKLLNVCSAFEADDEMQVISHILEEMDFHRKMLSPAT